MPAEWRVPDGRSSALDPLVSATWPPGMPVAEVAPFVVERDVAFVPDTVPALWECTYGRYARIDVRSARRRRWFKRLRAGVGPPRRADD